MKVQLDNGTVVDLGATEMSPTISMVDYSRRVTDDFGVTTVVERGFARRLSLRFAVPFADVDALQRRMADLRATTALWIADPRFAWLKVRGFYKDFDVDLAVPPLSLGRLTVEGLVEAEAASDPVGDPAPAGHASTLQLLQPVAITEAMLVASSVAENDAPAWAAGTSYAAGARVIRAHRIFESLVAANAGNDPVAAADKWLDTGPTNRWAMFDQALGTSTSAAYSVEVTLAAGTIDAIALLDVAGAEVRVQAGAYSAVRPVTGGAVTFLDLPVTSDQVTVTILSNAQAAAGTLLVGRRVALGVTEASPTAAITDYSRKEVDGFGAVTVVQRAWAKRMTARAVIRTDAIDLVANRLAAVRARPSLWIGKSGLDSLTVYGFFKEWTIEAGESVSKLSLSIEGLSKAAVVEPFTGPPGRDGEDGRDGINGTNGVNGTDGAPGRDGTNGTSAFFHVAYANSVNGQQDFTTGAPGTRTYIGVLVDQSPADSENPALYTWSLIRGADGLNGANGVPGAPGADGRTSYVHFAYANAADGSVDFSTTDPAGRAWLGVYSDFVEADSNSPGAYVWSRAKGANGASSFTLLPSAANGNLSIEAGTVVKTAGGTSFANGQFHALEDRTGGCEVSFLVGPSGPYLHVGLARTDIPPANSDLCHFLYAWHVVPNGNTNDLQILYGTGDGGTTVYKGSYGYLDVPKVLTLRYDNRDVIWLIDGVEVRREANVGTGRSWRLRGAINTQGSQLSNLTWSAAGSRGADGPKGDAGAIGARGADGTTWYTYYAYANSSDGSVDFTTGEPGDRAYVGFGTGTSSVEPTTPNLYSWSAYRGPPFGMASRGTAVVAGNSVVKQGGPEAWDSDAYSTTGFKNGCYVGFTGQSDGADYFMAGLNTDPTANASYDSIDFAWFLSPDNTAGIYESGVGLPGILIAGYGAGAFRVDYDGRFVRYLYNGVVHRTVDIGPGYTFYFDSSIARPGRAIRNIEFGSYATRAGNGVTLVAQLPSTQVSGNSIRGTASSGWGNDKAYSRESYARGVTASWTLPADPAHGSNSMTGLTGAPTNGTDFTGITFALFRQNDGHVDARVNGNGGYATTSVDMSQPTRMRIHYDGKRYVRYYVNDTELYAFDWGAQSQPLYFASALASANPRVEDIALVPAGTAGADGRDGLNGSNGAPGAPGANGQTSYLHTAYANAADGSIDFTTGAPGARRYLGVLVDFTPADSENPGAYTWSLIKGADGLNGANGTPGAPGANGQPSYVHIAYSNAANGSVDFSTTDPAGRAYVGFYVDQLVPDSNDPNAYAWSLVKGADGAPGAPGSGAGSVTAAGTCAQTLSLYCGATNAVAISAIRSVRLGRGDAGETVYVDVMARRVSDGAYFAAASGSYIDGYNTTVVMSVSGSWMPPTPDTYEFSLTSFPAGGGTNNDKFSVTS